MALNLTNELQNQQQTSLIIELQDELHLLKEQMKIREQELINDNLQKDKFLAQQSKMAAMGEMLDAVAHQWKQPLNAMSIMADLLQHDFKTGLVNQEYINELTQTAQIQINHLVSTLDEFRNFFRPNLNQVSSFLLIDCIQSVQLLMKDELIINNIIFYTNIEDSFTINANENEFKHIFINLICNTIDAFKEKKKFVSRHIFIRAYTKDSKQYIEFEDNAGGVPVDILENIFQPHITSKKEGTGIGLYMTSQILDKYHGKINVHNSSMGALFSITLD